MIVNGYEIKPDANLRRTDLNGADLSGADLSGADLSGADLSGASLYRADLSGADLSDADLYRADLSGADLRRADLYRVNLSGADLRRASLSDAILYQANIIDAKLSPYSIVPESGSFVGWKKLGDGSIAKLEIPATAQRCSTLVGRKCRASAVKVLSGQGISPTCDKDQQLVYKKGRTVVADSFDPDPRTECAHGIHFFLTKKEAEEW